MLSRNPEIFNDIVDLLVPYMMDDTSRGAFVIKALFGEERLIGLIESEGSPKNFTINLVQACDRYGRLESGQLSVVALLKEYQKRVSTEYRTAIDRLIARVMELNTAMSFRFVIEMPTRRQILIYYSEPNLNTVRHLIEDLKTRNITIHASAFDGKPGTPEWRNMIEAAIKQADGVILVDSPQLWQPIYVQVVLETVKPLYQLWIEGKASNTTAGETFVDLSGDAYETGLKKLIAGLTNPPVRIEPPVSKFLDTNRNKRTPRRYARVITAVTVIIVAVALILFWRRPDPPTIDVALPDSLPKMKVGLADFAGECATTADELQQKLALDETITIVRLSKLFSGDGLTRAGELSLLIYGTCSQRDRLTLTGAIATAEHHPSVLDLESVTAEVSALELTQAAVLAEALIQYVEGGLDNYKRITDNLSNQTLSDEWIFLRANSFLYQGFDHYDEALADYALIPDNSLLRSKALNNIGVAYFNQTIGILIFDRESDVKWQDLRALALDAFEAGLKDANGDLKTVIQVNLGTLLYTLPGKDEEDDLKKAKEQCDGVESVQAYICRAAARYFLLYYYPKNNASTCDQVNLQPIRDDLAQARWLDPLAAEAAYQSFWEIALRYQCTDPDNVEARQRLQAESVEQLNIFRSYMKERKIMLDIDLYSYLTRQFDGS